MGRGEYIYLLVKYQENIVPTRNWIAALYLLNSRNSRVTARQLTIGKENYRVTLYLSIHSFKTAVTQKYRYSDTVVLLVFLLFLSCPPSKAVKIEPQPLSVSGWSITLGVFVVAVIPLGPLGSRVINLVWLKRRINLCFDKFGQLHSVCHHTTARRPMSWYFALLMRFCMAWWWNILELGIGYIF